MSRKRSTVRAGAWLSSILVAAGIGLTAWEFATTGDLPNMFTVASLGCTLFVLIALLAVDGNRAMRSEEEE